MVQAVGRLGRPALDRFVERVGLVLLVLRRGVVRLVVLRVEEDEVAKKAVKSRPALLRRLGVQVRMVKEDVGRGLRKSAGKSVSDARRNGE